MLVAINTIRIFHHKVFGMRKNQINENFEVKGLGRTALYEGLDIRTPILALNQPSVTLIFIISTHLQCTFYIEVGYDTGHR